MIKEMNKIRQISSLPNPKKGIKTETRLMYKYKGFGGLKEIFFEKSIYKYDSNGNKVEESHYDPEENLTNDQLGVSKHIFKYDSNGNKVEKSGYDSDGLLKWKFEYKYDSGGNMIEKSDYTPDGSLSQKHTYEYDSNGNMMGEDWYDSKGKCYRLNLFQYDTNGKLIIETNQRLDSSGSRLSDVRRTTYNNSSDGICFTKCHWNTKGLPDWGWSYKYDDKNRLLEKKINKYKRPIWYFLLDKRFRKPRKIPIEKTTYEYEEY